MEHPKNILTQLENIHIRQVNLAGYHMLNFHILVIDLEAEE